jgi:hypothetical protein
MSHSAYQFERWKPRGRTSWAWRVFKKHNIELLRMYASFDASKNYTYKTLGVAGADWKDSPSRHFNFSKPWSKDKFESLKEWSNSFNDLDNWINLNALVAISSAFETYIATIVPLALESDVGILFGTSRKIDGIEILKHGKEKPFDFAKIIESCTKGTWESRLNAYEKVFGKVPKYLLGKISDLEKIRIARNNIAHSFGRDIEASRSKGKLTTLPIEKLSRNRLLKLQEIVWKSAKAIDVHLFNVHVGEYYALLFYHELFPSLNQTVHQSIRAMSLKKAIGHHGEMSQGKEFCKGLVAYYEAL